MNPVLQTGSFVRRGGPKWESPQPLGRIVSLVIHKDLVIVATEEGVYQQCADGKLHPMIFARDDFEVMVVPGASHG